MIGIHQGYIGIHWDTLSAAKRTDIILTAFLEIQPGSRSPGNIDELLGQVGGQVDGQAVGDQPCPGQSPCPSSTICRCEI